MDELNGNGLRGSQGIRWEDDGLFNALNVFLLIHLRGVRDGSTAIVVQEATHWVQSHDGDDAGLACLGTFPKIDLRSRALIPKLRQ